MTMERKVRCNPADSSTAPDAANMSPGKKEEFVHRLNSTQIALRQAEARAERAEAMVAAQNLILREWLQVVKSPGEGEYAWVGGTLGAQTEQAVTATEECARDHDARVRAEATKAAFTLFNDYMSEFVANMKVDQPMARETMKRRMLSALGALPSGGGAEGA